MAKRGAREAPRGRAALRRGDCVGVHDLIFLGYPDGMVEPTLALRRDLARVIRTVRPDVVLTQSPERNYDRIYASHPDHLATGEATLRAVYPDARNPHAFPALANDEGLAPHTVAPGLDRRRRHRGPDDGGGHDRRRSTRRSRRCKCHKSQVGDGERLERCCASGAAMVAKNAGLPKGRLAEAFRSSPPPVAAARPVRCAPASDRST